MTRQHAIPIYLDSNGASPVPLTPLALSGQGGAVSEADIQELVHAHPSVLPISEIDSLFADPIAVCTELNTRVAGSIDNFLVTATGLPILVECKLWRNPEARREVVGQILDYARALSRFSSSDIQREVAARLGGGDTAFFDVVRAAAPDTNETLFNDALTRNLRTGRFLLLVVGDGIREGVEAIAQYLQTNAGLHFTLGLVELPIFEIPGGGRIVAPRIVARTQTIVRTVVAAPEGMVVEAEAGGGPDGVDEPLDPVVQDRVTFWTDLLRVLELDDPEQPIPQPSKQGYIALMLPAPSGSCWLTIFRNIRDRKVGIFLSYTRGTIGERAVRAMLEQDWEAISAELGPGASRFTDKIDRSLVHEDRTFSSWTPEDRAAALRWLSERSNAFVNVFRPRVRAAVADILQESA
ncbi:MAG TPA: hypothetical protein VGB62_02480 [Allosphingosinicella sp.]|jgi:hypothetical protein